MTLNVSRKQNAAHDLSALPTAFRQVELWANGGKWNNITLNTSNNVVVRQGTPQWFLDPFGFVHLRGSIQVNQSLSVAFINVASIPSASANPTFTEFGPILQNGSQMGQVIVIPGASGPTIQLLPSASLSSGSFWSFFSMSWSTFK
jgi:hypothetical protein